MATPKETIWSIEPHTQAKHQILQRYLKAWFPILGKYHDRLIYIDGFCGPGRYSDGEPGSPILALDAAREQANTISSNIEFWFIDKVKARIEHLDSEIEAMDLPSNLVVRTRVGLFDAVLDAESQSLMSQATPAFVFVDPFGFEGAPFRLIESLLRRERTEMFINFFVDSVNRFIEHPDGQYSEKIVSTFGTDDCKRIIHEPGDRRTGLHHLYKRQLETVARFVRPFAMKNVHNRTNYDCFFATNSSLGHQKMKESMWSVDPEGTFSFSDAVDPNQTSLFDADDFSALESAICMEFRSRASVRVSEILQFVMDRTIYIKKHMDAALRELERNGHVQVAEKKTDGTKRRKNNFNDGVVVTFVIES